MSEQLIIPLLHSGTTPALKTTNLHARFNPISVKTEFLLHVGDMHWHDYLQLWYTVSGSYDQIINGERIHQTAGSLALIFPFTTHSVDTSVTTPEDTRIICISIFEDLFSKNIMPFRPLSYTASVFDKLLLSPYVKLSGKNKEKADTLFEDCLSAYSKSTEVNVNKLFSIISDIFEFLAQCSGAKMSDAKISRAHENSIVIAEAARFISENSKTHIPLDEISRLSFMSKRSFNDKFKNCTGQNFYDFYAKTRMRHVIWDLRFTSMSLSEIAEDCGYYDSVHLSHTIKNMFGISPAELRSQMLLHSRTYGEYAFKSRLESISGYNLSEEYIKKMHQGAIGLPIK